MSLEDWLNEGKLQRHVSSPEEIERLANIFERDLKDAMAGAVSVDRRFATAYNAALVVARAALAADGYRTSGEANHYLTVHSLSFTLGQPGEVVSLFNRLRKKRNITDYEQPGLITEQDVAAAIDLAGKLHQSLAGWLKTNHPDLLRLPHA